MMEKIYENFKKDESSIAKGNGAELFCYFLLKSVRENKNKLELHGNGLKDISVIYHSYGGSQKCDLESIISFENLNYSWHIYIESKCYDDKNEKDRNKSIEGSVTEFIKKNKPIDFLDFYLIFIPGQKSLNKVVDYLNQLKNSKDCNFPRFWGQIASDNISKKDFDYIQNIIKSRIYIESKKVSVEKIDEVYSELINDKVFLKISNCFVHMLQNFLESCYGVYIKDSIFDEFGFKELYSKPNLDDIITRDELIKKIDSFFSLITEKKEFKERAIKLFNSYLLRKYGYQKELAYFNKIERIEKLIYNDLVEYLLDSNFEDIGNFNKEIANSYSLMTDDERIIFIKYIVLGYMEKVGLFYANVNNLKMLRNGNKFYIKEEND